MSDTPANADPHAEDPLTGFSNVEAGARIGALEYALTAAAEDVGATPLRVAAILLTAAENGHESGLGAAVREARDEALPEARSRAAGIYDR